MVKGMMTGQNAELDKRSLGFNDVRDCALMHLKAIQVEEAKNQRFVCSEGDYWLREFATWMSEEFASKGFNIVTKEKAEGSSHQDKCSHARAEQVLGITFSPIKQAGIDMVNSMVAAGNLKP